MSVPTVVLAAPHSGAGKTTIALALLLGLRRRGLRVQPFKVGPDYLDASLLSWAAGRSARNLDSWMLPGAHLLELFHRACRGADLAVVEGVMGLFDGRSGGSDAGSTAEVARLLGAPVILVLDAHSAARTVGAVGLGLRAADRRVAVAGAILNRLAGQRHAEACRSGLLAAGLECVGEVPACGDAEIGGRYLGLVSAEEARPRPKVQRALGGLAASLNLEAVLAAARPAASPPATALFPSRGQRPRAAIAVARDAAFNFYYRDSLDLLQAWGAELVPFSPLADSALPARAGAVYLGGGYPELHAAALAANEPMLRSLRRAYRQGAAVYAECGGAMYAGAGLVDADGGRHRMARLWPGWTTMRGARLRLGYREVRTAPANFLHPLRIRGHEFHHSRELPIRRRLEPAWEVLDDPGRREGWAGRRLVASYIHLHLGAVAGLAGRLVAAAAQPPR